MPVAYNGKVYEDEFDFEMATNPNIPAEILQVNQDAVDKRSDKQRSDQAEMRLNETSGDFQSRFGAIDTLPTMPLQASTELAGALKRTGSGETPARGVLSKLTGSDGGERYQTWPEKAFMAAVGAMALPGEVSQGKTAPDSLEAIERAADLAMTMVGLPAPVASKLADGTLGSFAGVRSAGIKMKRNELGEAQILESNGVHPDKIYQDTGFFRGTDNRWRYEIDDSKASFDRKWADNPTPTEQQIGMKSRRLPEVLDHPELYAAYPKLKDINVIYDNKYKGIAEWDGASIIMGRRGFDRQEVVMHEVQHIVQDLEGFSKGGTPGKATKDYRLKYQKDVEELMPEMRKLYDASQERALTAVEEQRINYLGKVAQKYNEYVKGADALSYEYYMRLAGETESRNVETRLLMNGKERRQLAPRWTQDVDSAKQIVINLPEMTTAYGVVKDGKRVK